MSEMIDRAAAAVALAMRTGWLKAHFVAEDGLYLFARDVNPEDMVRVVIDAMREPTEAMLDAAWRLPDDGPAIIYKSAIEEKWREMIEAALKDD
jgi:hypothetical protein